MFPYLLSSFLIIYPSSDRASEINLDSVEGDESRELRAYQCCNCISQAKKYV